MAAYGVTRIVRTAVPVDSVLSYLSDAGRRAGWTEDSDGERVLEGHRDRR